MRQIFISISSYRDPQLPYTVKNLLEQAKYPERLKFGICHQNKQEELAKFQEEFGSHPQIKIDDVDYLSSKGCCWSRARIQEMITNEDYYLQIDSHHRMVESWDTLCETMLEQCREMSGSNRVILSSYLTCCKLDGQQFSLTAHGDVPYYMTGEKFYDFPKVRYVPAIVPNFQKLKAPKEWCTISGHFIFTSTDWVREVPYDPQLYFDGEEDAMGLRSWTRGYDLYYPHRVIGYHYYIREGMPRHTDDSLEWPILDGVSKSRLGELWSGKLEGKLGLGNTRTLQDYYKKYGIDYQTKTIRRPGQNRPKPPTNQEYISYENGGILTNTGNSKWQETNNGNSVCTFQEESRDNDTLTLFDASRQMWLRFKCKTGQTIGQIQLKYGNIDWHDFQTVTSYRLNISPERVTIIQFEGGGQLEAVGDRQWIESADGQNYSFREIEPLPKLVVLDESRKLYMRCDLTSQEVWLKFGDVDWFLHKRITDRLARAVAIRARDLSVQSQEPIFTVKGSKSIAVVTLGTPNLEQVSQLSRANQAHYCRLHDYNYIAYGDSFIDNRYVTWNKVFAIKQHLKSFDWLIWMDNDAIFTDIETTLESIITLADNDNPKRCLVVADDIGGWKLNTGVMFWRNCANSEALIDAWLSQPLKPHSQGAEQSQLINLLTRRQYQAQYLIISRREINAPFQEHQQGDFILHMMGRSGAERVKEFSRYNEQLEIAIEKLENTE